MYSNTVELAQTVPYADYEQLRTQVEQRLWQDKETAFQAKLNAPFVTLNEQSRLMINGPKDSGFPWPTIVKLEKNPVGISMGVEVVNGCIGRPLLFDRDEGEIVSHYGDIEGGEYFNAFTLDLDYWGDFTLSGHKFNKKEIKTLDDVDPQELVAFGRAVLFGINYHEAKLYEESKILTAS